LPINPEDIISTGGSEALLLQWVAQWIKEMNNYSEPFYANYNGFSTASGVTVPVISSIDTGFAFAPIADFEN
jgi:aspartate aminotransferase